MQLNRESLIQAWRAMTTIRHFEERVQDEFSKGGIPGFVHLYAGQEASAVGICTDLGPKDYIASTHRGHGHSIAKGCDVSAMMAELFGKQDGLCAGKGGSMHIADLDQGMLGANGIVGGGPPLVVGAALTAKTLRHRHRRGVVHRRRRLQPGHRVRGDEPGGGAASCRRSSCSRTTATANTPAPPTRSAAATSPAAPRASACRR